MPLLNYTKTDAIRVMAVNMICQFTLKQPKRAMARNVNGGVEATPL